MLRPKILSVIAAVLMMFVSYVSPGVQAASPDTVIASGDFLMPPQRCANPEHPEKLGAKHVAIVFATDRELACDKQGKPKGFTAKRSKNGLHYGIVVLHLDKVKAVMSTEPKVCPHTRLMKSIVHRIDTPFQKNSHIESVELVPSREALFERIPGVMKRYGYERLIVRVHGYNNDWLYSVRKSGEFAYWSNCLVINWAWPSDAKKRSYFAAAVNAEWTLKNFEEFVDALAVDSRFGGPNNIGLTGHSMGTRIIFWYEKLRYEKLSRTCPANGDVVTVQMMQDVQPLPEKDRFWFTQFASPDMDTETYCHDGTRVVACSGKEKVFNYISKYDHPLRWSKGINGYTRLGRAGVDLDWKVPPKVDGVTTIDFSVADHGPTGHAEPQWLESDMASFGKPRSPWKLRIKVPTNEHFQELYKEDCDE